MNKSILILPLVLIILFFSGCIEKDKAFFDGEIEKANSCSQDSDCVLAENNCYYCAVAVNDENVDSIDIMFYIYAPIEEECPLLNCAPMEAVCRSQKCTVIPEN